MEMFSIPSLCNSEFGRAAEDHWYWIKIGEMFRLPILCQTSYVRKIISPWEIIPCDQSQLHR